MDDLIAKLSKKKKILDSYKPLPPELVKNLEEWFRVELTYTSNAIEGNTLSRQETAMVIEKGLTVEGKSIQEHLEATNHSEALSFLNKLADKKRSHLKLMDILDIHRLILQKIDNTNAGRMRTVEVRIAGSEVKMPNSLKVPKLMDDFINWLSGDNRDHSAKVAADAHFKLVSIHPFVDGNGRTARLLMNLLLMQDGYPPALIRKEDRRAYINSIEHAQRGGSINDFYKLIYEAVGRSLDIYLEALNV